MSRLLSLHHFGLMQPEQSFHGAHNGNEGVETQGFLLLSANNCSTHRHGYIYPPRQQSSCSKIVETSCEYGPLYDTLPGTSFNPNQSEPPITLPSTIKLNISSCIVELVGLEAQNLKLFLFFNFISSVFSSSRCILLPQGQTTLTQNLRKRSYDMSIFV